MSGLRPKHQLQLAQESIDSIFVEYPIQLLSPAAKRTSKWVLNSGVIREKSDQQYKFQIQLNH
jgi:hypothetical protein